MKELYDLLVTNKVSPNGLFVLHCTQKGYMYPNYVNYLTEQYRLTGTGHLKQENQDGIGPVYKITPKGENLLLEVEHCMTKMKRSKKHVTMEGWEENIARYNEMFPRGKKDGSSISFRTNPKELVERFLWFFKEYPEYTWDLVFQATQKYVDGFDEGTGYTYMQTSKYFIKKEDKSRNYTSTLANMCYNITEGNDVEVSSGFHYFGP